MTKERHEIRFPELGRFLLTLLFSVTKTIRGTNMQTESWKSSQMTKRRGQIHRYAEQVTGFKRGKGYSCHGNREEQEREKDNSFFFFNRISE